MEQSGAARTSTLSASVGVCVSILVSTRLYLMRGTTYLGMSSPTKEGDSIGTNLQQHGHGLKYTSTSKTLHIHTHIHKLTLPLTQAPTQTHTHTHAPTRTHNSTRQPQKNRVVGAGFMKNDGAVCGGSSVDGGGGGGAVALLWWAMAMARELDRATRSSRARPSDEAASSLKPATMMARSRWSFFSSSTRCARPCRCVSSACCTPHNRVGRAGGGAGAGGSCRESVVEHLALNLSMKALLGIDGGISTREY